MKYLYTSRKEVHKHLHIYFHSIKSRCGKYDSIIIIIRNMETGGAARCFRIFSPTTIIEFGSVWWIIWAQFVVPDNNKTSKHQPGNYLMRNKRKQLDTWKLIVILKIISKQVRFTSTHNS